MQEQDEQTKYPYTCGMCGRLYQWSADDISALYEQSPFMPCGDEWKYRREQPIRTIDITPTPEALQQIVGMLQAQIVASQEKIVTTKQLQESLWDNDIYYDCFTREQNKILAEALDIGFDHIIVQEEERIQHIQDGLTPNDNDEEGA